MALFKQYSGTVYDEKDDVVPSFRYRGYLKQQNKWSDWYISNNSRYNINLGDSMFLTQDGEVNSGDNLILVFETLETTATNRKFCYTEIIVTAESTNLRDIQIRPIQKVDILESHWDLYSTSDSNNKIILDNVKVSLGRVNDTVTVIENFTDNSEWVYKNHTMFQHAYFGNVKVFLDRLGIVNTRYDWGTGLGIETAKSKIYTNITNEDVLGYIPVTVTVTNKKGLTSTDKKYLRIRYRKPIPDMACEPIPYTIVDTLIVHNVTIDSDNTIINTKYIFNNILQDTNSTVNYTWYPDTVGFTGTEMKVEFGITYSDGFEEEYILYTEYIELKNIPLTFDIVTNEIELDENLVTVISIINVEDLDGDTGLTNFKWEIHYKTPIDNEYKLVYTEDYGTLPAPLSKSFTFNVIGDYKIVVTGKDEAGEETKKEAFVTVTLEQLGYSDGTYVNYVEWE